MLKWLYDRAINAGQKDVVVAWDSGIQGHRVNESGIKQLWFHGLCLTACPPQLSDTCCVCFSISNKGQKAIAIGAQGTRLAIARDGKTEVVEARQLADDSSGEVLAKSFLIDIGDNPFVSADFGPIPPFREAVLCIQAKRIMAPQISFQIPFLLVP